MTSKARQYMFQAPESVAGLHASLKFGLKCNSCWMSQSDSSLMSGDSSIKEPLHCRIFCCCQAAPACSQGRCEEDCGCCGSCCSSYKGGGGVCTCGRGLLLQAAQSCWSPCRAVCRSHLTIFAVTVRNIMLIRPLRPQIFFYFCRFYFTVIKFPLNIQIKLFYTFHTQHNATKWSTLNGAHQIMF